MQTYVIFALKRRDWKRAYVVKFQDLKCLEHGLEAGERTWFKSGYVSLTLGPHGAVG